MRLLVLVSGGIDSPVAAHVMLGMGHDIELVHFDNGRFSEGRDDRVERLAGLLAAASGREIALITVDNEASMSEIDRVGKGLSCVLCKRNMVRTAGTIAIGRGHEALVMGDSLGQVASQTLDNIASVEDASPVPVVRPLIGWDKTEIMDLARAIGTYVLSSTASPACRVVPGSPAISSRKHDIWAIEEGLGWDKTPPTPVYSKVIVRP